MGSASSKTAQSASRKFPARSAGSAVSQTTRPARAQPNPADVAKDQEFVQDAADPDFTPAGFANRLRSMGIVDPNPTYSPSSRATPGGIPSSAAGPIFPSSSQQQNYANVTLSALASRRRIQERADADTERFQQVGIRGAARRYVDMRTLADALQLLDKGVSAKEVEGRMGMQEGLLERLGRKGVVTHLAN